MVTDQSLTRIRFFSRIFPWGGEMRGRRQPLLVRIVGPRSWVEPAQQRSARRARASVEPLKLGRRSHGKCVNTVAWTRGREGPAPTGGWGPAPANQIFSRGGARTARWGSREKMEP